MTWILANCFDGISNGTTVTTGNSGGASGQAFDNTTIGTGAGIVADTSIVAHPYGPAASGKFTTGGTAATAFVNHGSSFPTNPATCYFRVYGYFTANPSSAVRMVWFGSSGTLAGAFVVNTTGTISFIDSAAAVQLTSTHTIPLNSWFRLEGYITGAASTGKAEFKCYFTSPDSTTPDETQTSPATLSTLGAISFVRWGIVNSLSNITLRLDEVLVSDIGYMGPSVASPACRVGASVFNSFYGSGSITQAANWDAVVSRDMASGPSGVWRRYYQEGELPATSGADSQNVLNFTSNGIKAVVSFHPWRDSTNAYSGTITGQGITYAQEFTNLQNTLLMYFSNGIQPHQLEFALWHEENGNGIHGPFGDCSQYKGGPPPNGAYTVSTSSQAEANYDAYVAFYAPAFAQMGLKLTYIPAVFSNNVIQGFFPGNVTAAHAAYHNAVLTDYYWLDYHNKTTNTLANTISLATTFKLKLGIGEWGFVNGSASAPNASQFTAWCTATTGQFLAPLLSFQAGGGVIGDVIWFAGSGGTNNLTGSTDPAIIAAVQQVYDQLTTTAPPLSPSALFPEIPGAAVPGNMSPGDPGSLSPVPPPPSSAVNQWSGTVTNDPGIVSIPIPGYQGNGLVAYIGWNDAYYVQQGATFVADDAHDFWQELTITPTAVPAMLRGAIWAAMPNANTTYGNQLATCVSVAFNFPVTSGVVTIVEIAGLPSLAQADFTPVITTLASTSVGATASPPDPVWAFALAVTGNNTVVTTAPSTPWQALSSVSVNDPLGSGHGGDLTVTPVYAQVNAGSLTATFTNGSPETTIVALCGIMQSPNAVVNSNNDWPVISVQAAFGAQIGGSRFVGLNPFTWTDITSRAIYDSTSSILDTTRGRSYELTGPESGTTTIWLNNSDGALTPGNPNSPYYPNVLPQTPIQVIATWNSQQYALAYGYVDKWPQTFGQDSPQWGMTNVSASDAMGVLSNLSMYSAYDSEVLLDAPYAYWPLGDTYGEANGLPFLNLGSQVSNLKPMVGEDSPVTATVTLQTGLTLNLQGDTGSGIGVSGLTNTTRTLAPGAICIDPALPQMQTGLSIDFWASVPAPPQPSGGFVTPLVTLLGASTNFGSGGGPVRFQIAAVSGVSTYTLQASLADFAGNVANLTPFTLPNDGLLHHHAFVITYSSPTWSVAHYQDGVLDTTKTNSTVGTSSDVYAVAAGPVIVSPIQSTPYNYTIAKLAIYPSPLAVGRIQDHFTAGAPPGATGFSQDTAMMRFKRIMQWSQTYLPMAATPGSPSPLMGQPFSLAGQAVTDSFNDLLVSEGGWPYADAAGNTWWAARTWFYNRAPKWVFGDNAAGGEIPFDPGQSFDFDNAYLYTQTEVTRQVGQSSTWTASGGGVNQQVFSDTGAIVHSGSLAAQLAYGNRNALSQNILTSSDQDVYDRIAWNLGKYTSAYLRIPTLIVDAGSNSALWPVLLGAESGDVVQVNRRPLGGAPYSVMGIIVKVQVQLNVANSLAKVTYSIVPYNIESSAIQVDITGVNTPSQGIGW